MENPHWIVGPTWARNDDGSFKLPEFSLGWDMINWYYKYLLTPGGPNAGSPFLPTLEQARFLVWWYAVDSEGKFIYREGTLRRLKGWGKDPLVGVMALGELCGPVEFSHFENGRAVGKLKFDPWVQIAAVSQDQTRNTFTLFPSLISPLAKEEFKLDVHKTIVYDGRGKMIEGVTSSPTALEGKRPTFVVQNEVQWWVEANNGKEMANVIKGNVSKSAYGGCRSLSICNAHIPGQDSVGEANYQSMLDVAAGKAVDTGVLYDSLEAPSTTPVSEIPHPEVDPDGYELGLAELRDGLSIARGDAVWLDLDRLISEFFDTRVPVSESRRMYLNQVNASEDSWISPAEWDSCGEASPLVDGERITLGFDGSLRHDHTALSACRVDDGAVFLLKTWDPADYPDGEVPRDDVDAVVRSMFERYKVVAMRCDVFGYESYIDAWAVELKRVLKLKMPGSNPIAFDMRGKKKQFALDCERFLDAVLTGDLTHDHSAALRWYILNAHRAPTVYDAVTIRKKSKDSDRKIDAAVTSVLAFAARQDFVLSRKFRSGGGGLL